MRLLLLLSALLTALSGVASPRAQAQPMQASASATTAAPTSAAVATAARRFAVAARPISPPLRLATPDPIDVAARWPLYAERRRE